MLEGPGQETRRPVPDPSPFDVVGHDHDLGGSPDLGNPLGDGQAAFPIHGGEAGLDHGRIADHGQGSLDLDHGQPE